MHAAQGASIESVGWHGTCHHGGVPRMDRQLLGAFIYRSAACPVRDPCLRSGAKTSQIDFDSDPASDRTDSSPFWTRPTGNNGLRGLPGRTPRHDPLMMGTRALARHLRPRTCEWRQSLRKPSSSSRREKRRADRRERRTSVGTLPRWSGTSSSSTQSFRRRSSGGRFELSGFRASARRLARGVATDRIRRLDVL